MPTKHYCVDPSCGCHARPRARCCPRCHRNGPKPLTIVPPAVTVSPREMFERVLRTRAKHGKTLAKYHQIWYEADHTWAFTHFLGIGMMKCPNDLWVYQDLMTRLRPTTVIETGTYAGASALYFAYLMDMLGIKGGRVITIDIDDHLDPRLREQGHPRVTFLRGSSTDPKMVKRALALSVPGPRLVALDSDHSHAHVLREMELYAPHLAVGDWMVVEDTNVAWVGPNGVGGDRGAQGAVADYLTAHPGEFAQDLLSERYLLTMNPGGWLFRTAAPPKPARSRR